MNKKVFIIVIVVFLLIILVGILLISIINKKTDNTNDLKSLNNLDNYVTVLDVDGNIVSHIPINDKPIETIENTTIQG